MQNSSVEEDILNFQDLDAISIASYESGDEEPEVEPDPLALTSPTFAYEPLDQNNFTIRVLVLMPAAKKQDDVHCRLEPKQLSTGTQSGLVYEALSYAWGQSEERRIIYVNGDPFPITPNLDTALRYLRKPFEYRVLWVDAVCIDQKNLEEKSAQVRMMRNIYKSASQVLVWLGLSDRDIRKAIIFIKGAIICENDYFPLREIVPFLPGLYKFFNKPWWSRIWVVQEVMMARKPPLVVCGRRWISWKSVLGIMDGLVSDLRAGPYIFRDPAATFTFKEVFVNVFLVESKDKESFSLVHFLIATSNRESSQPHDKIFALLGLAEGIASEEVEIDYNQSYSTTYQNAMVHVMKSTDGLNTLALAISDRGKDDIPSWCADFSQTGWDSYMAGCGGLYVPSKLRSATSGMQPKHKILHNPGRGTIELAGTVVGRINHVAIPECRSTNSGNAYEAIYRFSSLSKAKQDRLDAKIYSCILIDVSKFSIITQKALTMRLGKKKALDLLASGIVWEMICAIRYLEVFSEALQEELGSGLPPDLLAESLHRKRKPERSNAFAMLESFAQRHDCGYAEMTQE